MFDLQKFFEERKDFVTDDENEFRRRRDVFVNRSRYLFDSNLLELGWEQFDTDQDASYFGIWVNKALKSTLTFAEGDLTLMEYKTVEDYNGAIMEMMTYYSNGVSFVVINQNKATKYFEDRTRFLIKPEKEE